MKKCSKCKEEKELTYFDKDKRKKMDIVINVKNV